MAQAKLRGTTFEIQATANDTVFSYANKPLKFNGDLQYKSGVAYVSLVSKLGLVDQAIASETVTLSRQTADTLLQSNLDAQVALLDADVVDLNHPQSSSFPMQSSTISLDSCSGLSMLMFTNCL